MAADETSATSPASAPAAESGGQSGSHQKDGERGDRGGFRGGKRGRGRGGRGGGGGRDRKPSSGFGSHKYAPHIAFSKRDNTHADTDKLVGETSRPSAIRSKRTEKRSAVA